MTNENQNTFSLSSIDTGGLDFTELIPVIISLTGGKFAKPAAALQWYLSHKGIVDSVVGFFRKLIGHKASPATVPPPAPVVLTPPPAPVVPPKPVTPPTPSRVPAISALKLGILLFKEWQGGRQGSGEISSKQRYDAVLGGDALGRGAQIHLNATADDENGKEIGVGDPRHDAVAGGAPYLDIQARIDGEETPWIPAGEGDMLGPLELHSYDDDYGFTDVVKVPADFSGQLEVEFRQRVAGTSIVSPWTPALRVS